MVGGDDESSGGFASPPCSMHEIDPFYAGLDTRCDPQQERDVRIWRKAARERLIKARMALLAQTREGFDAAIMAALEAAIAPSETSLDGLTVSAYWPFRAEPDPRPLIRRVVARGGRCALPVVVGRGQPLVFRAWAPGQPLGRAVWNIPIPLEDAPMVVPDVVIAPLVGFDPAGFRLGYGGGFFDRTLAAMAGRPQVFGVGYDQALLPTIFPQWHDIAMDRIVTESGLKPKAPDAA